MVEKCGIGGKIYDVIEFDEYRKNPNDYANHAAVRHEDMVLPVRGRSDSRPGIYNYDHYAIYKLPETEAEIAEYSASHIINFSDCKNMRELMANQQAIVSYENAMLSTTDNELVCSIGPNDEPMMKCLKTAINLKKIDWNKYGTKFGDNVNNQRRLLKTERITGNKLVEFADNLDIEAILILRDTSSDVPNPMGKEVSVKLTGDNNDVSITDADAT